MDGEHELLIVFFKMFPTFFNISFDNLILIVFFLLFLFESTNSNVDIFYDVLSVKVIRQYLKFAFEK